MLTDGPGSSGTRLAELTAALSLATDLGMGQPMEHALRTCLLAVRLAEGFGLSEIALGEVYYVALLRRIGCTSDAHELGMLFGDDLAPHARSFLLDFGRPLDLLQDLVRYAGAGSPLWDRIRTVAGALSAGPGVPQMLFRASCEAAERLARQLGFEPSIQRALGQTFERWDGKGFPNHVEREGIALPVRIVQVVEAAEVFHRLGSVDAAVAMVRKRAGSSYDPAIAEVFCRDAGRLFDEIDVTSAWEVVLTAEPGPPRALSEERLDSALQATAQFADLKSTYTAGHSSAVAALAATAASRCGLPQADVVAVRRAALVHDLGRVAVSSGIWEKPGPLTHGEWEQVRLHPYYRERVLARSSSLSRLGSLAGLHHERLDGSGYHRGAPAGLLPVAARILSAADAYQAMTEPRPHRPAVTPEAAAGELRRQVSAGRLDGDAVDGVLKAVGHRVRRRREWPAGLSAREVEVLRLVTRGLSNRDIARTLVIAEPTVAHHVQHTYNKIGVSTRAGATVFAMQHALLDTVGLAEE